MTLPKTHPLLYASHTPERIRQTISLRTQLRLNYETYSWLRYLTWTGLLIIAVLLVVVPGSFPPRVFLEFWQLLPQTRGLLILHGPSAFFSLMALLLQVLTWLLLWGLFLLICQLLARYTWRLHHARSFLTNGWQSSTALTKEHELQNNQFAASELAQRPSTPFAYPRPVAPHSAPEANPNEPLVRRLQENSTSAMQPRQFAQPASPAPRPRTTSSPEEGSLHGLNPLPTDWPSVALASGTGIAWDSGLSRKNKPNEDSVLTLRGTCNFSDKLMPFELHIIADGMGGHAHGGLASHLAIRSMLETVVPGLIACAHIDSEQVIDILIDGVQWANQVIYQSSQEQGAGMGTTITAVLLLAEIAYIINVGDSRTYVYRPQVGLSQVTRDHSLVARLVEKGAITPEEVYTHPERNKVYRGLGDQTDVTVDWFMLPVLPGDILLLCSDGLWEMVRDHRIAEVLQTYASAPALASNALLRSALQAGGSDNVSLLVIKVQP